MGLRSTTRDVPLFERRANFEPSTVDAEKRTVELTWTTGARVRRGGWFTEPFMEELSLDPKHVRMDRLNSGAAPLLNSHRSYSLSDIIGVVDEASLDGKRGRAKVRFDRGPVGEEAFRMVREGILKNVSVGYRVHKLVETDEKDGGLRVYRAEDWEPYELSMVPIGADAGAGIRSEQAVNPCVFVAEERNMKTKPENENPTPTPTNPAPAPAPQPTASAGDGDKRAAELERERILGIQRVGAALRRPQSEIDEAIRGNVSLDEFRANAVDKFAEADHVEVDNKLPARALVGAGEDEREKFQRGATAWIIERAGLRDLMARYAKKTGVQVELDPGEFRGARMLDIARRCLERDGVRTEGMLPRELFARALTQRGGAYATVGDFPVLLESVMHKTLLAGYAVTPDSWRLFCAIGSVSDFREHNRYRLGSFGKLDRLNEHGEYTNKPIPDGEKEKIRAATVGNIIGITRQALVDDDLGAFTRFAAQLGRSAALSIEIDVFDAIKSNGGMGPTMSDGKALFHTDHNNINTSGSAIGVAALSADKVVMAKQTDPSGNEVLDLRPAILIVPIELGDTARDLNSAEYDPETANKFRKPNSVRGMFSVIVDSPRLSGTRRYLLADPSIAPTFEVAFLDGQEQPYMEMQQGWRVDGVEWKVRHDYGVAAVDFRGAVTNAGA